MELDKQAVLVYVAGLFVMKTTIIALAAMASPLMAQEAAPAAPAAPAPAPEAQAPAVDPAEYAKYEAPARETINNMKQLLDTLKGVNSKETADAAAPKVKELMASTETLRKQSESLPEPSEAIQNKLKEQFEGELQGVISGMMGTFLPLLSSQCYGSQALMDALAPFLNGVDEAAPAPEAAPEEAPATAPAAA